MKLEQQFLLLLSFGGDKGMGLREDIKTSKMHFRRGNSKTVYFITMHIKQTIRDSVDKKFEYKPNK